MKTGRPKIKVPLEGIDIIKKCFENAVALGTLVSFYQGIITGNNKKFLAKSKVTEEYKPILRGSNIKKYHYSFF